MKKKNNCKKQTKSGGSTLQKATSDCCSGACGAEGEVDGDDGRISGGEGGSDGAAISKAEVMRRAAVFKNPDEFYFKMMKSKTVHGVHMAEGEANKYTNEELMLMKTHDIGYILQKLQSREEHDVIRRTGNMEIATATATAAYPPLPIRLIFLFRKRLEDVDATVALNQLVLGE